MKEDSSVSGAPGNWRREASERIADCRIFQVRRDVSIHPVTGAQHDFFCIEAPDWINIIPLTSNNEVVLIEQYRHGIEEITLEIPGGMIDQGETPEQCASRELTEETGYSADELSLLGKTRPNPAIQNNWIYSYLAKDVFYKSEPVFDGTEHTVVRLVPLNQVPELIASGKIVHSLVVVAFHLLAIRR